nr:Histone-like transcription factor and archaeal histone family protein, expressed [Oryza sativa Japonica Group]
MSRLAAVYRLFTTDEEIHELTGERSVVKTKDAELELVIPPVFVRCNKVLDAGEQKEGERERERGRRGNNREVMSWHPDMWGHVGLPLTQRLRRIKLGSKPPKDLKHSTHSYKSTVIKLPYAGQPAAAGAGAPVPGVPGAGGPPAVPHHHLLQQQQAQLQAFWAYQRQEAERASASDFKNHQLPLARIKKIMKADEDVRMISAEAPVLFAKACELFILELTIRSWLHAEENKRRTLQRNDVAAAIARTDVFDFLVDIVPREEAKEEPGSALGFAAGGPAGAVGAAGPAAGLPYYYPPMGQPAPMMPAWHVPAWDPAWQQGAAPDVDQGAAGSFSEEGQQGFAGHGGAAASFPPAPPSSE